MMSTPEQTFLVLVIEDTPLNALLIGRALSEHGVAHEMIVLKDGEQALDHLQHMGPKRPDLMFLDLGIPKHDGLEVLVKYRMNVALFKVPLIVLTSFDADSVYLAAARGLAELRRHGWVEEIPEGLNCLRIVVSESREVTHTVTEKRLQQWAMGSPRSPAEVLRRAEVRRELGVE